MSRRPSVLKRQAIARKFYNAIRSLKEENHWDGKQMAKVYDLPWRTVYNWLKGRACPRPARLRKLCSKFRWTYEVMFEQQAVETFLFEEAHLSYLTLNRRYVTVVSENPLESWNYVSLAGALVFNDLSAAGFECFVVIDHNFGCRAAFRNPRLAPHGLQIAAQFTRGLTIQWVDENGSTRGDAMILTKSTLDLVKKTLHSYIET